MEREIKCPSCGTDWALAENEFVQASFICPECTTTISLHPADSTRPPSRKISLHSFSPVGQSKRVFILTMVAYNLALQSFIVGIVSPLVGAGDLQSRAHSLSYLLTSVVWLVVWYPIWQTTVFSVIMETLTAIGFPYPAQVFVSAVLLCATDGLRWSPHALYSFPGFLIMGISYVHWRKTSLRSALVVVFFIHALFNGVAESQLVMKEVGRHLVSKVAQP